MVRRILLSLLVVASVTGALLLPAPSGAEPVVADITCAATEPMTPRGSITIMVGPIGIPVPLAQLGAPVAQALDGLELPIPVPIDLTATDEIAPGGTVDYAGGVTFDLGTGLTELMVPVREAIAAAGYPELAETLEVRAALDDLAIPFPHPAGTTGTGTPTATGDGVTAAHAAGALTVHVEELVIDTETGVDALDTDVTWSVLDGSTPPPADLVQTLGSISFGLDIEITGTVPGALIAPFVPVEYQPFLPANLPVTLGASGPWSCTPDEPAPALATTAVVDPTCISGFSDVGPLHQFCPEITWAADAGLVSGWPDGTYRPVQRVSRQHFAAMLYRDAGSPEIPDDAPTFTDVPEDHLFADAIRWLADEDIAGGYDDGTFRPTQAISRQGIAAMFHREAGSPAAPDDAPTFTDVGPSHPFRTAIAWLAATGITGGYEDGTFRPNDPVTRQVIAAFFQRRAA